MSEPIFLKDQIINNRYKILKFVGEGGMQQVFLVEDQIMKRFVALKTPKNDSAEKRFRRSAILSAKINHPHVAKTYDYFEDKSRAYLIEEFVEGTDLQKSVLRVILNVDPYLVAKIFHYVAKGLAACHHVNVIHRDLKPSNVLISGGLNLDEIKLTDFGIAKLAEEELTEAIRGGTESMSGSKTLVGALPYMSPEMIEKTPKGVSTATDIWSIGAMMYELIAGRPPFGVGLPAVPLILSASLPPKPTIIDSNAQFKVLGNQLYNLIMKCLIKDPTKRISADLLVSECEQLCYPIYSREKGVIEKYKNRNWGFIRSDAEESIFFHINSIYGEHPKEMDRVYFSAFPGHPTRRAYPIVKLRN